MVGIIEYSKKQFEENDIARSIQRFKEDQQHKKEMQHVSLNINEKDSKLLYQSLNRLPHTMDIMLLDSQQILNILGKQNQKILFPKAELTLDMDEVIKIREHLKRYSQKLHQILEKYQKE